MNQNQILIDAQMQLECINEAWNEMRAINGNRPSLDRCEVIIDEISSRIWAAIFLVQASRIGFKPERWDDVMKAANAHNGVGLSDSEGVLQ